MSGGNAFAGTLVPMVVEQTAQGEMSAVRARIREDRTLDLLKANARIETE